MTILKEDLGELLRKVTAVALRRAEPHPIDEKITIMVNSAFARIIINGNIGKEFNTELLVRNFRDILREILKDLTPMVEIAEVFHKECFGRKPSGLMDAEWEFFVRYNENLQIAS